MPKHPLAWAALGLLACHGEYSAIGVTAEPLELTLDAEESPVELEAELTYPSAAVPRIEVSNALRLSGTSDADALVEFFYPGATEDELTNGGDNLLGVYVDCGEPTCVEVIAFETSWSPELAHTLTIEGDAILSSRRPTRARGDAALVLRVARP